MNERPRTRRRYWLPSEVDLLQRHYADQLTSVLAQALQRTERQVLNKASTLGLHKSSAVIAATARQSMARADHPSRAYRFCSGNTPWNTGTHYEAGGRSALTRFQPGQVPPTTAPLGSLRVVNNKHNWPELQRKVSDEPGPCHRRWRPVARLVWEAEHGPVPDGHVVVFKEGQRSTELERITLDALECITRPELMARNSVHRLPPEFAEYARLRAALSKAIQARERKERRKADAS